MLSSLILLTDQILSFNTSNNKISFSLFDLLIWISLMRYYLSATDSIDSQMSSTLAKVEILQDVSHVIYHWLTKLIWGIFLPISQGHKWCLESWYSTQVLTDFVSKIFSGQNIKMKLLKIAHFILGEFHIFSSSMSHDFDNLYIFGVCSIRY